MTQNLTACALANIVGQMVAQERREHRLVLPCPTASVAKALHERLLEDKVESYLVLRSGAGDIASESMRWLLPDALTSIREGSFVLVLMPGTLSQLQDSISGSGGAIRAVAFADEWPWSSGGQDDFDFERGFLDGWLALAGFDASGAGNNWAAMAREIVLEVRDVLEPWQAARATYLFDELLSHPPITGSAGWERVEMLLHAAGFPSPGGEQSVDQIRRHLEECKAKVDPDLVRAIRARESRTRAHERLNAKSAEMGWDLQVMEPALDLFLDRIAAAPPQPDGSLALNAGLRPESQWGLALWRLFSLPTLRTLFVDSRDEPPTALSLSASWIDAVPAPFFLTASARTLACNVAATARLRVQVDPTSDPVHIEVRIGRTPVDKRTVGPGAVDIPIDLPLDDLRIRFPKLILHERQKVTVSASQATGALAKLTLELIIVEDGRDPAIIVESPSTPARDEVAVVRLSTEEEELLVSACEPTSTLHVLPLPEGASPTLLFDGKPVAAVEVTSRYDSVPLAQRGLILGASGSEFTVSVTGKRYSILLRSDRERRGPPTVQEALVEELLSGTRAKLLAMSNVFSNRTSSDAHLGTPETEERRFLMEVGAAFESEDNDSALPIIFDFSAANHAKSRVARAGTVRFLEGGSLPHQSFRLEGTAKLEVPDRALLDTYTSCRSRVIHAVRDSFSRSVLPARPLYASAPLCHIDGDRQARIDVLLADYLEAYCAIVDSLRPAASRRSFAAQFVLTHLDSLVHSREGSALRIVMLGPWHPLVATCRFFCQLNLLQVTRDAMSGPDVSSLAHVFSRVTPFRWVPALTTETRPQPFYCAPTADSGWIAAAEARGDALEQARDIITNGLGLETSLLPQTVADDIAGYLRRYQRAFPSRRALVARIDGSYTQEAIMGAAEGFFFEEGDKRTAAADLLPGGLHLYFSDLASSQSISPSWSDPPICVYVGQPAKADDHIDLLLAGARIQPEFEPLDSGSAHVGVARGNGAACILAIPPRELSTGFSTVPSSRADETTQADDNTGVGAARSFVTSLIAAQTAAGALHLTKWRLPVRGSEGARWVVIPGSYADPAVFLEWSKESSGDAKKQRVLWDYKVALTGGLNSFYVISDIPPGFLNLLTGDFVPTQEAAAEAVGVLASVGIAVGNEAYRSRTAALGVLGIIGATKVTRALSGEASEKQLCILLPVDSFTEILGKDGAKVTTPPGDGSVPTLETGQYGDLLLLNLEWGQESTDLKIRITGVEGKYRGKEIGEDLAAKYAAQAESTVSRVEGIARRGRLSVAHRWVLGRLIEHGLRLASANMQLQGKLLSAVLRGEYSLEDARLRVLLVSTEEGRIECSPKQLTSGTRGEAWWVRLGPSHFPYLGNEAALASAIAGVPRLTVSDDASPPESEGSAVTMTGSQSAATSLSPDIAVRSIDLGASPATPATTSEVPQPDISSRPLAPDLPVSAAAGDSEVTPHPSTAPDSPLDSETADIGRASVLLGVDDNRRQLRFDTSEVGGDLGNYNMMVSGSSGNGKSQLIKSIAGQLARFDIPSMFVDFKNDFADDREFLRRAGLEAQWIAHDGLPFNPMIPGPTRHPGTGEQYLDLPQHLSGLQAALQQAYDLGDQQTANTLRKAVRDAFVGRGIDPSRKLPAAVRVDWPDFNDIAQSLEQNDDRAFARLSPLFDLGVFREAYKQVSFASILGRRIVLDLSQVQAEKVKMTLAHLILYSAHGYLNSQPHSPTLRHLVVFDEAHRVLKSPTLESFSRECRAYGVALLLSSQNPTDFPASVKSNLATKIICGNGADAGAVSAIKALAGLTEADTSRIAALGPFQAIVAAGRGQSRFATTLGYPHWVVWQEILRHPAGYARQDVEAIPGIHAEMLDNILRTLREMGLVEAREGRFVGREPR